MIRIGDYWFGTPKSLASVFDAVQRYLEDPQHYPKPAFYYDDDEDAGGATDPALSKIQVADGVGILDISGELTASESWLDAYFGLTSYPVVARGVKLLAEMQEAGEIHSIIHAFSTPGGDASGINGLTEVMQGALEIAPNTVSYSASQALSAGYWLASINPELVVDEMAEVGSIGVISVARSIHRALQEDGVDVKVMRSGKFKALLHPYEPLSEEGIRIQEEKQRTLHGFFKEHIKRERPKLAEIPEGSWAEGQTFFGAEAVQIGLADRTLSLNRLVNELVDKHNSDKKETVDFGTNRYVRPARTLQHTGAPSTMKVTQVVFRSEADKAKVASGVPLSQVDHALREVEVEDGALVEPVVEASAAAPQAQETTAPELSTAEQTPAEPGLVEYLRSELKEAREEAKQLALKLASLETEATQLRAVETQLSPIVIEAIQRLQVGLGRQPTELKGLPATTLATQYAETLKLFNATFPVGLRAQSGGEESRAPIDLGEQRLALVK